MDFTAVSGRYLWAPGAPQALPHAPAHLTVPPVLLDHFPTLRRPAHALYFAAYEAAKEALGGGEEGHHPFAVATAGVFATVTSDACMTPFDVVKQRLQVLHACKHACVQAPHVTYIGPIHT